MRRTRGLVACLCAVCGLQACPAAGAAPAPRRFVDGVTNPWFPLRPGTVFVYRGVKDGKPLRDVVTVTAKRKLVAGVKVTVVSDHAYLRGRLAERTSDWYAQDTRGNVWYYGEATAELGPSGRVTTTEGSWEAGVDGARAGILVPAHPRVGQTFLQEYYKGQAEDHARVLSLSAKVRVPYTTSTHALLTKEWTPLEPGVVDHKLYVRGIGMVEEETVQGGEERAALVSLRRG